MGHEEYILSADSKAMNLCLDEQTHKTIVQHSSQDQLIMKAMGC
jgi:hypothetical protein